VVIATVPRGWVQTLKADKNSVDVKHL